jgi:hypothetical protein
MKTRKFSGLLVAILFCAAAAGTQGFWDKKDWKSWSKDECKKMQEDSPWAHKWYRTHVAEDRFGQPTKGDTRETEQQIFYVIQLRSALPIRQAFIRDAQVNNKYDKMSAKEKQNFDASADAFLSRKYEDVIVVHVIYGTNIQNDERALMRFWQTNYLEGTVPMEAFLTTSAGKRVPPIRYVSAKGGGLEFELIFPRTQNGEPIVTPDVKTIGVEFQHPEIGLEGGARVYQEFKTDKMMVNGVLVF